ncbi:MAG: ketoacyl-ACP synthase III [Agathobacter sp.]|nr:ketoacyl-ACP synthase III [Agathobacter sp.]
MKIIGTGSCLPERIVTNQDLAEIMDTSDEWISTRTGIRKRHIATEETTTSMSVVAAKRALEDAGVKPEELDLIIAATVSSDQIIPMLSAQVQAEIGADNAVAFDINAACSGFLFDMAIADAYMKAGGSKKALLIGAETLSKLMDWNDRSSCVLFGDGAGAVVVSDEEDCVLGMVQGAKGKDGMVLSCVNRNTSNPFSGKEPAPLSYVHMEGQAVYKFAVKTVPAAINEALEQAGVAADEVSYYILHQANLRIIESVAKRLDQPMEKFPTNIQDCGNISAASVPILLDKVCKDGMIKAGDKIVLAGFGAGLTWGACVLSW